jgi:hypothetical protein
LQFAVKIIRNGNNPPSAPLDKLREPLIVPYSPLLRALGVKNFKKISFSGKQNA